MNLLTAIGLTPGGSNTAHICTQTVHRRIQNVGRVRTVHLLCELYPGICLTTEEKARKTPSLVSQRVPAGTIKTERTEQIVRNNKNT
jgi:hypothetical protein